MNQRKTNTASGRLQDISDDEAQAIAAELDSNPSRQARIASLIIHDWVRQRKARRAGRPRVWKDDKERKREWARRQRNK